VNLDTTWWEYLLLFFVVAASWAGVPFVGATGLTAAAVAASQGELNLAAVVLVATAGGEAGGLLGYAVGNRWGRQLLERPGKHQAGRQKMVEHGEQAYARWGRLAVFFTPAVVSGTAAMRRGQFAVWNLVASFAFALSVAATTYGLGRLFSGHHAWHDIAALVVGLAVGALITVFFVRRRRRVGARRTEPDPA
jgi:membrane protein DedA with SNARE-associated domain